MLSVQGFFGTLDEERCAPLMMIAERETFLLRPVAPTTRSGRTSK
jgi:hypothetical protein